MDSDAKPCMNAGSESSSWNITTILSNVLEFRKVFFFSCSFKWVNRDVNGVTHAMPKVLCLSKPVSDAGCLFIVLLIKFLSY